jgi:uncharacterized protein YutE (UPF0331/DUF86 family)
MTVNKDKVEMLVGQIGEAVALLEQYRNADSDKLVSEKEKLGNIKYQFVVAAEACIDLCNHIAAKGLFEAPESYSKCFDALAKHGVIGAELAAKMADLARFRNLLVHLYWKVDDREVVQNLHKIGVLREFASAIAAYVGRAC